MFEILYLELVDLFAAMMKIEGNIKPTISGGNLTGEYIFAQLHFHWGGNDTCGSEKKFDKKSFPLELHMVFHKKDYLNVDSALSYTDGLTVLACIFEVGDLLGQVFLGVFLLKKPKIFRLAYRSTKPKI